MAPKFTDSLLASSPDAFKVATNHPFLRLAGTASLPEPLVLSWLTQDRLYALSYVSFIGSLLSKSSLPSTADRVSTVEWKIVSCLIDALSNIRREVGMFEDILRSEFDWQNGGETPRHETKAYTDLFAGAAAPNQSLLVGITVLWATEKCYLESWRYAQSCGEGLAATSEAPQGRREGDDVLRSTLIPNWTCSEFVEFVENIGMLVDELAAAEGVQIGSREWVNCEEAWKQVLWAEERFWPDVKE